MSINKLTPGFDLYLAVRTNFILQGTTLSAWCRQHEVKPANAKAALVGIWNGPKGRDVRQRLIKASRTRSVAPAPN